MKTTSTKLLSGRVQMIICLFLFSVLASGQGVPEYMYFKFDAAGSQQNYASTPVGTNPAPITGLTIGGTGQFGTALVGTYVAGNSMNTGWATSMPNAGWTISMWVNNISNGNSNPNYLFGDVNATSFRCFSDGAAGANNIILRGGGLNDVIATAAGPGPTVVTFVYTGSSVKWFENGVLGGTVAQPSVTITGAGPFLIGAYSTSAGMPSGGLMDEFRMYSRALSDAEVGSTWNQPLPLGGPPIVVTMAAGNVTSTTATLNGTANANGYSTTVTFNYGLTTAYGSTIAGVPGSVTGSTVNPVTAALTGLLPGNTYHFRVSGTNSSGTTNGNDMTFLTPAVAPTVTTTAAAPVYGTMATLNGTVNAGGASTTVTFEYGTTIAYGSIASAAQSPVTGNITTSVSADLSGLALSTLYHFRAKGVNSVATVYGADMSFTTLNCNSPGNPGTISGSASVCVNSSGKVYSVPVITNATGYVWTVPAGAVITAGANTNTITVTFGAASGNVSVYGTSAACGNGPVSTLAVAVNPVPVPSITGQNSLCVNSGNFTYSTQAGQTAYTWVVSSGGTILNGTGSSQITVAWTVAGAQTVSINYTTLAGCSASSPTVLPVTVNGIPSAAGSISGTSVVCVGTTGVAYSVGTIPNALSYVWTLPTGASIASGSGTNAITVNFGTNAVSGNITVLGNNLCGNGPASTFAVTVNPYPAAAGVITGVGTVCQGQTGVGYMISPVTNASGYTWTVPSGATITAGGNTTLIDVSFSSSASSGIVSVVPVNSCGNGTASPNFPVTVNVTPPSPVITLNGDGFTSSAAAGNQWYRYLTLIPGATAQVYVPTQAGLYTDQVSLNGCASNMSNAIYFSATGIAENSNIKGFEVYPNPNAGEFTLTVSAQQQENYDVVLYSTLGVKVFEMKNISSLAPKTIDLRPVTSGVYLIVLQNNTTHIAKRITVE